MKHCFAELLELQSGDYTYKMCDGNGDISEGAFPAEQIYEFEALLMKYKYSYRITYKGETNGN